MPCELFLAGTMGEDVLGALFVQFRNLLQLRPYRREYLQRGALTNKEHNGKTDRALTSFK